MSKSKKNTQLTIDRRELAKHLLTGKYCRFRMNNEGVSVLMIYQGNQEPVKSYYRFISAEVEPYLKKDKDGRMTLNLNQVRQLHGKSILKRMYKALKNKEPVPLNNVNDITYQQVKQTD